MRLSVSYLLKFALGGPLNAFLILSALRKCEHNARHTTGCSHSNSEGGLLTQQISASYQHTGLSGRCCLEIILTHTHRVSTVNSISQGDPTPYTHLRLAKKKKITLIFFCRLQRSITTYTMCLIITVPEEKKSI